VSTPDEYRQKALECAEAADRVSDLQERLTLLEIAQAWFKLADRVTGRPDDGPGSSNVAPSSAEGSAVNMKP
jgi:hypothetical protein